MIDRRAMLGATVALSTAASSTLGGALHAAGKGKPFNPAFPKGFLWGAATAAHQVEGNNTSSDVWFLEHMKPTVYAEPSGDAANSFLLWETDLDLVKSLGLNTYRFSLNGRGSNRSRAISPSPCSIITRR